VGFTLLELTVVMLLLAILLGFAIPAFRGAALMDTPRSTARKIAWAVKKLKHEAITRQEQHTLHLDLDAGRIWATRGLPAEDKAAPTETEPWSLPEGTRIDRILFPAQRRIRSGTVAIGFYAQGFSDRAIVRLTDGNDDRTDILIEAFLPFAQILEAADGHDFGDHS
jgi:prepilin-type N-terminal cleavage/methylation domain-containing protein